MFSCGRIRDLYPIFWSKASEYCEKLEQHIQQSGVLSEQSSAVVDITEWNQRVTLDTICLAGFGSDPQTIQHPDSDFYKSYRLGFIPSKGARLVRLLAIVLPA